MDTSKKYNEMTSKAWHSPMEDVKYVLMCEKAAEEIQGYWTPHPCNFNGHIKGLHKDIWLPRQDQLQEMVKESYECGARTRHAMLVAFIVWYRYSKDYPNSMWDMSMEQLWLAFVMKEKFNKQWNNKEWIKSSSTKS